MIHESLLFAYWSCCVCDDRKQLYLQEREKGFDNDFGVRSKLPEYNALQDDNMKRFFENSKKQKHLWKTGQVRFVI